MYHCFLQCGCFYIEVAIMKHKHLTYEDRLIIQQELENSTSLHKIAQRLHKSDSTISREIFRNRYQVKTSANHTALCARVNVCTMANLCSIAVIPLPTPLRRRWGQTCPAPWERSAYSVHSRRGSRGGNTR